MAVCEYVHKRHVIDLLLTAKTEKVAAEGQCTVQGQRGAIQWKDPGLYVLIVSLGLASGVMVLPLASSQRSAYRRADGARGGLFLEKFWML